MKSVAMIFLLFFFGPAEIRHSSAVYLRDGTSLSGKVIGLIPVGKDIESPVKGWRRIVYEKEDGTIKFSTKSLGSLDIRLAEINWLDVKNEVETK